MAALRSSVPTPVAGGAWPSATPPRPLPPPLPRVVTFLLALPAFRPRRDDVLIVCGDVSDEMAALETALATLKSKFGHVFYVPGKTCVCAAWQKQVRAK